MTPCLRPPPFLVLKRPPVSSGPPLLVVSSLSSSWPTTARSTKWSPTLRTRSRSSRNLGGKDFFPRRILFLCLNFCVRHRNVKSLLTPKDIPPPKASLDDADDIPESTAAWYNILTFGWITPLMTLGYARPLEATDLYKLQDHRASAAIAEKITTSFERRQKEAAEYNERLANGEISLGLKGVWWSVRGVRAEREKQWREKDGRKRASLVFAMNDSVKWWFWTGGLFKLISDVAQITSPLLVKVCFSRALAPRSL